MGFHVSVIGMKKLLDSDCSRFIDKNYYNFTCSYELYGNESVLVKSGEYFDLDLRKLGTHLYIENEADIINGSDYLKQHQLEISYLLPLIKEFKNAIQQEPDFIKHITFDFGNKANQREYFEMYTSSPRIIEDLKNVLESIECHLNNGESHIYFYVG